MATQTGPTTAINPALSAAAHRGFFDVVQEWVTTVDHKKIGLMYIGYALIFLIVAGVEALIIRVQLLIPNNNFVSPRSSTASSPCTAPRWSSSWACPSSSASAIILFPS